MMHMVKGDNAQWCRFELNKSASGYENALMRVLFSSIIGMVGNLALFHRNIHVHSGFNVIRPI